MSEEYYDFDYVEDYTSKDETLEQCLRARIKQLEEDNNSLHEDNTSLHREHIIDKKKIEIEKSLNEGIRFWDRQALQHYRFIRDNPGGRPGKKSREILERRLRHVELIRRIYLRRIFYAHPSTNPLQQVPMERWKMVRHLGVSDHQFDSDNRFLVGNKLATKDDTIRIIREPQRIIRLDGRISTEMKFTSEPIRLGLPWDDDLEGVDDPSLFDPPAPRPRTDPRLSDTALITRFIQGWTLFPVAASDLYEAFRATLAQGHQQQITATKFGRVAASLLTRQHTRTMNVFLGKKGL